ncbi:tetratricopeptide repeat protein [Acetivibrio mesophilus]|uniref:Tetratricopeptide repeat protein n=1 Tax=Acetivibrio mesophilus TaxID=2487273 RepID=A0A4V1K1S1_9FIRM|nr:tetratricopeptide repeat protein [Acetivibrio mesophilus]RXE57769.1 hypothetical protein EFD62_15865 [Acetivibrio mesophilus]
MMDFKNELQNYSMIDLDRLSESNPNIPDNIKNSILLYNKALEDFRAKSEDIAIIELKKAISLNPDFHEAINLLGIFYMYIGENDKAAQTFQKVIDAEKNSIMAMKYLKEIDSDYEPYINKREKDKKVKNKRGRNRTSNQLSDGVGNKSISPFSLKKLVKIWEYKPMDTARLLMGFIFGVLLVFLLSYKYYFREEDNGPLNQLMAENKAVIEQRDEIERKYNELDEKYQGLNGKFEEVKKQVDYYLNTSKLLEIEKYVSENKYREAADLILLLKNTNFTGIEKEKYDKLSQDIMPKAAQDEYNQGRELYNRKNYQEAVERFERSRSYSGNWRYSVNNLYYLGVCYQELNNSTKALEVFEEIVNKYPTTAYAGYSKDRINQIRNTQQ